MAVPIYLNVYVWLGATLIFGLFFIILFILLIMIARKTHAIVEFKATQKGVPISMFFTDQKQVEWRPIKPDAGIVTDKDFGAYIINERGSYVDRRTRNIFLPFDANVGVSLNVKAAKLIDDLGTVLKDEVQMKQLRTALAQNMVEDNESVNVLKTSINFGSVKNFMSALIPHNINAKIEKTIAARMKNYGAVNIPQIILVFVAIFGAIILGAIVIKFVLGK